MLLEKSALGAHGERQWKVLAAGHQSQPLAPGVWSLNQQDESGSWWEMQNSCLPPQIHPSILTRPARSLTLDRCCPNPLINSDIKNNSKRKGQAARPQHSDPPCVGNYGPSYMNFSFACYPVDWAQDSVQLASILPLSCITSLLFTCNFKTGSH